MPSMLQLLEIFYDKNYYCEIEEFNRNSLDSKVDIVAKFLDERQFDAFIRSSDAVIINSKTNYNSGVLARCIALKTLPHKKTIWKS